MQLESIEELKSDFKLHGFRPVYVVLGPEEYLARQTVALLKKSVVPPDAMGLNFAQFQASDSTAAEFLAAANTFPMMAPRRLVLVEGVDEMPEADREAVIAYTQRPSRTTVLLLAAADLDRRTLFYRNLREHACLVEFPKLKGGALQQWAAQYITRQGHTISPAALAKVVEVAGTDLQSVLQEIEKLLIYAGSRKEIPDSAVNDLVQGSNHHGIFELTGALGARDKPLALKLLANLLGTGTHPFVVLTMMARHFRQILIVQEQLAQGRSGREAGAAAGVPHFVLDGFLHQVRKIDRATAERMFAALAQLDYRFKSSGAQPRLLLEQLICSL